MRFAEHLKNSRAFAMGPARQNRSFVLPIHLLPQIAKHHIQALR